MAVENSVKNLRKERKETQKDLALAIGVDAKTIRNIELTGTCSLEVALRLSKYYEMSVDNIFKVADVSMVTCSVEQY